MTFLCHLSFKIYMLLSTFWGGPWEEGFVCILDVPCFARKELRRAFHNYFQKNLNHHFPKQLLTIGQINIVFLVLLLNIWVVLLDEHPSWNHHKYRIFVINLEELITARFQKFVTMSQIHSLCVYHANIKYRSWDMHVNFGSNL